jgi:hypothetical protein
MAGNLGQFMGSGIFIYVMLPAVSNKNSAQFRNFREKFFPFHGLSGYGQNAGMTNLGNAEFFFLTYFIDFFKGFFQIAQGQTLGRILGVIVQVANKVTPVFPVGIRQPCFHIASIRPFMLSVDRIALKVSPLGRVHPAGKPLILQNIKGKELFLWIYADKNA